MNLSPANLIKMNYERIVKNTFLSAEIGFIVCGFMLVILSCKPALWEIWQNPLFMGVIGIFSGFILMLPRFIYNNSWLKKIYSIQLLYFIQLIILLGLFLNAIGALGLYLNLKNYDIFTHFFDGVIFSFGLYFIYLIYPHPEKAFLAKEQKKALIFTIFIFFSFAVLWEIYEYFGDILFKTQMFGEPGEKIDTEIDIIASTIGSITGIILARYNAKKLIGYFGRIKKPKNNK